MKQTKKIWSFLLVISASFALLGCNQQSIEEKNKSVVFHIGGKLTTVNEESGSFRIDNVEQEHQRFMGWSTDGTKAHIVSQEKDVNLALINTYFVNQDSLDLYAVYANVLTVNFVLETTTTFYLDSDLENKETIPERQKDGFIFNGWSIHEDQSSIDFGDVKTVSYSDVSTLANADYTINFYPVYVSEETSNIKLYQYSTADQMAEIHVETENHLAIDDESLIIPDEHKGKNGELPVYDYVNATINVNHCEEQYVLNNVTGKVKVRGNYTSSYKKKPIRIKFSSKQKMLGLNKGNALKSWVLLACWKDTSLLRDACAFYLGNALSESAGYYCSDFRFVKVYLNDSYNGVYLLAEQQQIDNNRVAIPESKNAMDDEKTGYFLEYDGYYTNEPAIQKFTVSYSGVKNGNTGFTVSNDIMNQGQLNFVKKAIQNIWKVVYDASKSSHTDLTSNPYHTLDNNGDYIVDTSIKSAKEAISKVIDIDSLVNMYLLHEIMEDRDIGFSSFYFSLDWSQQGNKKLTFTAPWDFDYSAGNSSWETALKANLNTSKMVSDGRMTMQGRSYKLKSTTTLTKEDFTFTNKDKLYCSTTDNPWFVVFNNEEWLWDMLYARFSEATKMGVFSSLLEMIDTMQTKYSQDYDENFVKWQESMGITLSGYQPNIITYFVTQKQASDYLRIWLEARVEGLGTALKNKVSK